jgi:flagellar biosynthesis protein
MTEPQDAPHVQDKTPVASALRYDGSGAPRLIAKGRGPVAEAIIAKARESGVTIEEDPILAEALASVELDAEIPLALYTAVAEVISTILSARRRAG